MMSGKFDLDSSRLGRASRLHPLHPTGIVCMAQSVRTLCTAMTAAGVPVKKQVKTLFEIGISIGEGGPGGIGSDGPECPYCGMFGNGGHGGNCPNMGLRPAEWVNPRQ